MLVSVSKTPDTEPVLAADLTDKEMEQVVKIVRDDEDAKWKDATKVMKNITRGMAVGVAPPVMGISGLLSGANFLRANAGVRANLGLTSPVQPHGESLSRELIRDQRRKGKARATRIRSTD